MTSHLPICFKFVLGSIWLLSGLAAGATVSGTVTPTTVVWLSSLDDPAINTATSAHARILQKNKRFTPHLLAVEVGTLVDFPNLDPIFHNAFSNFDGQLFDIGLYPPGSSRFIRFHREGLVRVFCNIHPSMSAVIVVLSTPYFTVTDEKGRYSIANVPAGQYKLQFFHERSTSEVLSALTRTVTVSNSVNDLGDIQISESGYIPTPHKNKFGHDYPVEAGDVYH